MKIYRTNTAQTTCETLLANGKWSFDLRKGKDYSPVQAKKIAAELRSISRGRRIWFE